LFCGSNHRTGSRAATKDWQTVLQNRLASRWVRPVAAISILALLAIIIVAGKWFLFGGSWESGNPTAKQVSDFLCANTQVCAQLSRLGKGKYSGNGSLFMGTNTISIYNGMPVRVDVTIDNNQIRYTYSGKVDTGERVIDGSGSGTLRCPSD
jgi:hypothetical protein